MSREIKFPEEILMQESSGSMTEECYVECGIDLNEKFKPFINKGDRVLEVGCGCARVAQALPDDIFYEGFDVTKEAIDFCNTLEIPNYNFTHVDMYNSHYNETGRKELIPFPYEDNSFDFVFLTSVFTHVMPSIFEYYASEVNRVLKDGKAYYATFFIIDDDGNNGSGNEWTFIPYKEEFSLSECYVVYTDLPDAIVGYKLDYIKKHLSVDKVLYHDYKTGGQDVVLGKK